MIISVFDEEKIKKHDLVGDMTMFLDKICKGEMTKEWIEITYKGKLAGTILLEFAFKNSLS